MGLRDRDYMKDNYNPDAARRSGKASPGMHLKFWWWRVLRKLGVVRKRS
jgi:hypothetical protein